ncbi:hypothetical protein ACHAWC_002368 [Mediolabrus comicus]
MGKVSKHYLSYSCLLISQQILSFHSSTFPHIACRYYCIACISQSLKDYSNWRSYNLPIMECKYHREPSKLFHYTDQDNYPKMHCTSCQMSMLKNRSYSTSYCLEFELLSS